MIYKSVKKLMTLVLYQGKIGDLIRNKRKMAVVIFEGQKQDCDIGDLLHIPTEILEPAEKITCYYQNKAVMVKKIMRKNAIVTFKSDRRQEKTVPLTDLKVNREARIVQYFLEQYLKLVKDIHKDIFESLFTTDRVAFQYFNAVIQEGKKTYGRMGSILLRLYPEITINNYYQHTKKLSLFDIFTHREHKELRIDIMETIYHELLHIPFNAHTTNCIHGGHFAHYEKKFRKEDCANRIW